MGPKNKSATEEFQQELLDRIANLSEKLDTMDSRLIALTTEKDMLKNTVQEQAKEIASLRNGLNEREQYARNWSMRCLNIPIPVHSETDTRFVMHCLYDTLLHPILEGAKAEGEIVNIPDCNTLLETAHILPGKNGAKPVIARFYSRYWRNLIFRHRKQYAPKDTSNATAATASNGTRNNAARQKFPFFEDLTRASFLKLASIKEKKEVIAAWTVNGSIRFRVQGSDTTYKVGNLADTFESIIGK